MKETHLVIPQLKHKKAVMDYKQEHIDHQEEHLHGSSMLDSYDVYEEWQAHVIQTGNIETVPENWVVSSTFLAMDEDEQEVIGLIDIRHELNDMLRAYGGHIGYGVRPSQRRKGYATKMLKLALDYAKSIGLQEVMIGCNHDNEASSKTILACGGVLEKETMYDHEMVKIYWITL